MYQSNNLFQILEITLPALIVAAGAILLVRTFLQEEQDRRSAELKAKSNDKLFPLRLNAYERLILFVERCSPSSLLLRNYSAGMSARDLQQKSLEDIRSEFEHNQTQQLYVTDNAWELVTRIKDETRMLINEQMVQLPEEASGAELSRRVLERHGNMDPEPYSFAIKAIKSEVRAFY